MESCGHFFLRILCYAKGMRWVLLAIVVAVTATPSAADEVFVGTFMPEAGVVSPGSGEATVTLNPSETTISYHMTFSGLVGVEFAAHFHRPDAAVAFGLPLRSPKIGEWVNPGADIVDALRAGQLYVVIHTNTYPGGELRANLFPQLVPTREATWGAIKSLYR